MTANDKESQWEYGGVYKQFPISPGKMVVFETGSQVMVHDIFNPVPAFMKQADCIFSDPPWNLGNLNTFYTKADLKQRHESFELFYKRFFECIAEIQPRTCYIEVGKEYLAEFMMEMKSLFKHVTFYNSSYYHRKGSYCYVIRGALRRKKLPLDGMDEEDIIKWVCENEEYEYIADPCMGTGLVGKYAHAAGRRFLGTELNHKRLALLVEAITKTGTTYRLEDVIMI